MTETLHFDMDAEEKDVFCQEAEELIGRLDASLLAIEQKRNTPEIVQDLFRAPIRSKARPLLSVTTPWLT